MIGINIASVSNPSSGSWKAIFGLHDVHSVITGGTLTKDFSDQFLKSNVEIIYA